MNILTLPPHDGPQVVARIISTRWRTLLLTVIAAVALMAIYLVVAGRVYTASTSLQLAVLGTEPSPTQRTTATSSIDMTSEMELVRSGAAAQLTVDEIGSGLTTQQIVENIDVNANPLGTVLTISWTDPNPDLARRISSVHAQSYLEVRRGLVAQRAEAIGAELDAELTARQEELATLSGDDASVAARRDSVLAAISSLQTRKASLLGYSAPLGRVVTSDSDIELVEGPSRATFLAGAAGLGLVLGFVGIMLRERYDHRVRGPRHLAQVVAGPVWGADLSGQGEMRWYSAAHLATLVGRDRGIPALVIGSTEMEAPFLLAAYRAAQGAVRPDQRVVLIDLDGPREDLIRALASVDHVVVAPSAHMRKEDVRQLVDQIDLSGCELIGAFFLPRDGRKGNTDFQDLAQEAPRRAPAHAREEGLM
ncbi:MAG: hypothetical protein Q4C87_03385 [Actinomycetaceae bacterium]|nr:hypothetical protein [Actinomycetaceae bacterium]